MKEKKSKKHFMMSNYRNFPFALVPENQKEEERWRKRRRRSRKKVVCIHFIQPVCVVVRFLLIFIYSFRISRFSVRSSTYAIPKNHSQLVAVVLVARFSGMVNDAGESEWTIFNVQKWIYEFILCISQGSLYVCMFVPYILLLPDCAYLFYYFWLVFQCAHFSY